MSAEVRRGTLGIKMCDVAGKEAKAVLVRAEPAAIRDRIITVRMNKTEFDYLEKLRELAQANSISDVIRDALATYDYLVHKLASGAEIVIREPCEGGDEDRPKSRTSRATEAVA